MFVARVILAALLALVDGKRSGFSEAYTHQSLEVATREQGEEVEQSLQPTTTTTTRLMPLYIAVGTGDMAGVNFSAPLPYTHGSTPAHYAAGYGQVAALRFLKHARVDLEAVDDHGYTPAHDAATWDNVEALRYLIEEGVNVNAVAKDGQTPADLAFDRNYRDAYYLLAKAGGRRNRRGRWSEKEAKTLREIACRRAEKPHLQRIRVSLT
eukprot:s3744_g4.t1